MLLQEQMSETKERARHDWQNSVASIVETGRFLTLKKGELSREEFGELINVGFALGISAASKLINIAKHPIITDPVNYDKLPPSWANLYQLALMPDEQLLSLMKSGEARSLDRYALHRLRTESGSLIKRGTGKKKNIKFVRLGSLPVPPGETIISQVEKGLKQEEETGASPQHMAEILNIGYHSYRAVRYVILLSRRSDLNKHDTEIVQSVVKQLSSEAYSIKAIAAEIAPIVNSIWGKWKGRGVNEKVEARRLESFNKAIMIITNACERGDEVELPHLPPEDAAAAMKQLYGASAALRRLNARIRKASDVG